MSKESLAAMQGFFLFPEKVLQDAKMIIFTNG